MKAEQRRAGSQFSIIHNTPEAADLCLTGFAACPTVEATHIQFMNALKPGHAVAFICVILLCSTALYIHQDNKVQRIKQAAQPAAWQPPASDEIVAVAAPSGKQMPDTLTSEEADALVAPNRKKLLTDEEFGFVHAATNANGTPLGAWAATLVRIPNAVESNLFKDPATGKLVHLVNGQLFEEKDTSMAWTPQAISYLTKLRLADQQQPKIIVQMQPPLQTHDYMNDYYQIETLSQNQQALQEMQYMRMDYERNLFRNSFNH